MAICTNIFIFLLKCNKQALGTVHCGYYMCYYLNANTKGEVLKKSHWKRSRYRKYNNHDLSVMRKLIHCIIWCFDFCLEPDPSSNNHLVDDKLITISKRFCHFMMHEFISPKGSSHQDSGHMVDNPALWDWSNESQSKLHRYHQDSGHMVDNTALCDWSNESQSKLHIVKEHFEHYLAVWSSIMVIYRSVYEILS
jgi:hypothetical protein